MTISDSMIALLDRIQPLQTERDLVSSHAFSIRARLEEAFEVRRFDLMGSHVKGTAIRRFSDADFLVILSRDDARWGGRYVDSRTLIRNVKAWLSGLFQQTQMRRDQQALVLQFGGGSQAVDIVPGFFEDMGDFGESKHPIYSIPDGNGGWRQTSPEAGTHYFNDCDERSGFKLSRALQLIKFWRSTRIPAIPLLSFHIELLSASLDTCVGVKSYAECLADSFSLLAERKCKPLRDPLGISGVVPATDTEAKGADLLRCVTFERDRSLRALELEAKGHTEAAKHLWNLIFHSRFPSNT